MSQFPIVRPRRLRQNPILREMVREITLHVSDLIYPLFIQHGSGVRQPILSMPGQYRYSVDQLSAEIPQIAALGIRAVLLFGIPSEKDPIGKENFADDGIVQQAIRAIKQVAPTMIVITDLCLCEYTDHGHCGLIDEQGQILNDETLPILAQVAVSHARAGADIVAPSGMLDGMVQAIRAGLDSADFHHLPILSYAVKYASAFYGPFRDAADGAPRFGDRRTHQLDPANIGEALREAALDIEEGADLLMVKPALAYLDVIGRIKTAFPNYPLVAYNVSGEYAMIKAAAQNGWIDEKACVLETLIGMKRAGADLIITYHARDAATFLAS